MNKFFSLLMVSAALCVTAGCGNKKQTKAAIEQKDTVVKNLVAQESATDTKEDYTIAA
jgi:ABC-type phosphate/phosphonate transport system substrate-binding protein